MAHGRPVAELKTDGLLLRRVYWKSFAIRCHLSRAWLPIVIELFA